MSRPMKIGVVCISSYSCIQHTKFHDSVVDLMLKTTEMKSSHQASTNSVPVSVAYNDNSLFIASDNDLLSRSCKGESRKFDVVLQRPPACPFLDMKKANYSMPESPDKHIQVASVALLESFDHKILLTKRPGFMRTFPNVWVPPGGSLELNEDLFQAALRELYEETNLTDASISDRSVLGLWESGFPLVFSPDTPPRRHHLVSYVHFKTKSSSQQLNSQLKLQPNEVDRAVWVCPCVAHKIVQSDDNLDSSKLQKYFNRSACSSSSCLLLNSSVAKTSLGAYCNTSTNNTVVDDIAIEPLFTKYSARTASLERVSTGTKFALLLWLEKLLIKEK